MFIIDLVWGLIQLGIVGGTGIFLWHDYRNNFVRSRALGQKAIAFVDQTFGREMGIIKQAQRHVKDYAVRLNTLREKIAQTEASWKQFERRAVEEHDLALEFEQTEIEALRQNKEAVAATAAAGKINATKRAILFQGASQSCKFAAKVLRQELEFAEAEFDVATTRTETMRVDVIVGEAQRVAYELVSDVNQHGLTPKGALEDLRLHAEHRRLTAESLVSMVRTHGEANLKNFMLDQEIRQELEETRKKLALPAPENPSAEGESKIPKITTVECEA